MHAIQLLVSSIKSQVERQQPITAKVFYKQAKARVLCTDKGHSAKQRSSHAIGHAFTDSPLLSIRTASLFPISVAIRSGSVVEAMQ